MPVSTPSAFFMKVTRQERLRMLLNRQSAARDALLAFAEQLSHEPAMDVLSTDDVELPIGIDYLLQFLQVHKTKGDLCQSARQARLL